MKNVRILVLIFGIVCTCCISSYAICSASASCGGGASITCNGSCECSQDSNSVTCDGNAKCCPQL